jgi:pimeloyl-ACP methyl ester carboxylesterase
MSMMRLLTTALMITLTTGVLRAQETVRIQVKDPAGGMPIKLEAFVYEPRQPNGQVIVFSHGSTGGKKEVIGLSIKFVRISKIATDRGYRVVVFMRKGRGQSEGVFIEESGRCDRASLKRELDDAVPQLVEVMDWTEQRFGVKQVILMGHSRGGFLSTQVAAAHPERVTAAVNLAGAWTAACETRNGGYGRDAFKNSASVFKNQYWAYFENDTYFAPDRFNDPNYDWFAGTAREAGIRFKKYPQLDQKDGHSTPTFQPEVWAEDVYGWLSKLQPRSAR